jgi:peptidoglycan hydrolase-like protein with peptidoglycan-binding domain
VSVSREGDAMAETTIELTVVVPLITAVAEARREVTVAAGDQPNALPEQDRKRSRSARRRIRVCAALAMLATSVAAILPSRAGVPTTASQLNQQELSNLRTTGAAPLLRHRPRSSRSRALRAPAATPAHMADRGKLPGVEQTAGDSIAATPALVCQVQFLLLSIGGDPGPIDGVPRQLTNNAVRQFERKSGLPETDLVRDGQISTALIERLRAQASAILLGPQKPAPPAATAALPAVSAPLIAAAPTQPVPPPVDRFAACPFRAADFRIGDRQYTPDALLKTGFGGSTANAVANLTDRLQEARQVALEIGGPALAEVQRQAKVLDYFKCRLKIEQASVAKN